MLPHLEKSVGAKLEGTVTRQIQTLFQTIGRQVLQVIREACIERQQPVGMIVLCLYH